MVWARMLGEDGNGTVCGIVIIELFCGDAKDCIVGDEYDIDAEPILFEGVYPGGICIAAVRPDSGALARCAGPLLAEETCADGLVASSMHR